jgi:hypothetical protein
MILGCSEGEQGHVPDTSTSVGEKTKTERIPDPMARTKQSARQSAELRDPRNWRPGGVHHGTIVAASPPDRAIGTSITSSSKISKKTPRRAARGSSGALETSAITLSCMFDHKWEREAYDDTEQVKRLANDFERRFKMCNMVRHRVNMLDAHGIRVPLAKLVALETGRNKGETPVDDEIEVDFTRLCVDPRDLASAPVYTMVREISETFHKHRLTMVHQSINSTKCDIGRVLAESKERLRALDAAIAALGAKEAAYASTASRSHSRSVACSSSSSDEEG